MSAEIEKLLEVITSILGGEYKHSETLDSRGVRKKRIIITYPYEDPSDN